MVDLGGRRKGGREVEREGEREKRRNEGGRDNSVFLVSACSLMRGGTDWWWRGYLNTLHTAPECSVETTCVATSAGFHDITTSVESQVCIHVLIVLS